MRSLPLLVLLAACSSAADDLAALAEEPAPCDTDADCCVVTDGCLATAYVVGKGDFDRAKELAREAEQADTCVGCESPQVDVRCYPETKRCQGREVPFGDEPVPGLSEDHCGAVVEEPWEGDPQAQVLGCGAGE